MTLHNKQVLLRNLIYACLTSIIIFAEAQAMDDSEDLKKAAPISQRPSAIDIEHIDLRRKRLELFGLDKFDNSFEVGSNPLEQMEIRNTIWKKNWFQKNIEEEIIKYYPNQKKLVSYIPYYLKEALDFKSSLDLKNKRELFSDCINLMHVAYKSLSKDKIRELDEELCKSNLEAYTLYPMFLRYLALQKDKISTYPSFMREKINDISLEEAFNRADHYKYHPSLESRYVEDQKWLNKFSFLEISSKERLNKIIALYNSI